MKRSDHIKKRLGASLPAPSAESSTLQQIDRIPQSWEEDGPSCAVFVP